MHEQNWNMDRPIDGAARNSRAVQRLVIIGGLAAGLMLAVVSGSRLWSNANAISHDAAWIGNVERGSLVWDVAASGSLRPANTRVVSALVAGSVVDIHRDVGDALEPGTPIATVDNVTERRRLLEMEQDLRVAEAALTELRRELESRELEQQKLQKEMLFELRDARRRAEATESLPDGFIPEIEVLRLAERAEALESLLQFEYHRAEAVAGSAKAQIEQQQARVEQFVKLREFQQAVVDSLSVQSPVVGVLKNLPIETGEWLNEGTVIAEIVEPGELMARLRVPESAAASLRLGLPAQLNARGIALTGQVSRIDPAVTSGTITVDVELAYAPEALRADLSVQGFIELQRLDDVVHMARPVGVAEHTIAELLRLNDNGDTETVRVQFGPSAGDRIQVLDGLDAGDRVVLSLSSGTHDENRIASSR